MTTSSTSSVITAAGFVGPVTGAVTGTTTGSVVIPVSGTITGDVGTGTCTTNAVTINKMAGVITTESLTTASAASQDITLTNSKIASGDLVLVSVMGGTNTTKAVTLEVVPGTGSAVIKLTNNRAVTALDGTVKIGFLVIKA